MTPNIKEALQQFASDSYTPLKQCDFIFHGVITYFKTAHMEAFSRYTDEDKVLYSDTNRLINERIVFRQIYSINPLKRKPPIMVLDYTIDFGPSSITPILLLKPSSSIPYQKFKPRELFIQLVQEVNKIKAVHGMLIGIRSDVMIEDIKKVTKQIYSKNFNEEVAILLFDGLKPEVGMPGKLILHFEQKDSESQIKEVDTEELIVTYIKPIFGKNGLNAYGKRVKYDDVNNEPFLACTIDHETIKKIEDERQITLFSKKRGFVNFNHAIIEISNKLTLQKISRAQSQIAREETNEIEIVIAQDDITKDSVGEGVVLTSETIHITGHVADKARLEAKTLIIDGASHKGSILRTKEAHINRHKGTLRSHTAHIKLLEGGEVHATHVHIDSALGGTVCAEHVTIRHVKQHLKIYATESMTIERISGEDNLLMIDYRRVPVAKRHLQFIENDTDDLRYHLEEAKRHNGKEISGINAKIIENKAQIESIKTSALHATISIKEPLHGYNTITFMLPKNRELSYKTRAEKYEPFTVEVTHEHAILYPVGIRTTL